MREAGANYVRMRLWVDPPPGYNDLASDLALARQVHAAGSAAFYSELEQYGVPFDVIGLSYYSILGDGPLTGFKANVDNLATEFRKPIVVAEIQYPWTLANGNSPIGDSTGDFAWETSQLDPGYPRRPAVLRHRRAVHPRRGAGRLRRRALLLGAGLDPRRPVGAGFGRRLAQRQPHPVQLRGHRAAVDRHLRQSRAGLRGELAIYLALCNWLSVIG